MNELQTTLVEDINRNKKPSFFDTVRNLNPIDFIRHPLGYTLLALVIFIASFLIIKFGALSAGVIILFVVGMPFIYAVIIYPRFGIVSLLIGSYIVMFFVKAGSKFPFGTIMDCLEFLLLIGFVLKHKYDRNWTFIRNPISVMMIIWISYNLFEVINPAAESRLAWLYTVRTVAIVMLTYFIFTYYITTVDFIRLILKVWIGLTFVAALYALKQEYFGFFSFEKQWLASDPWSTSLYFIDGHWRKFSIFSDPVALAYNMVISSVLCITLMFGPIFIFKKVILFILTIFFCMAMLYSGTRGAFVLIPMSVGFLFLLKLNKTTMLLSVLVGFFFIFLIKAPTSNRDWLRFQTAFKPSSDASFNVRKLNQKRIQPYIQSHPLGGGLGATGTWGIRFSPGSYLASFPPDSGYVRVAVELGWVGLLLFCTLMFVILRTGIQNYFKIKDPELKNYCLAMVLIVFALNIGNFPQEALVQFPINIYFYLAVALMIITLKIDKQLQTETNYIIS